LVNRVEGLEPGLYRYLPLEHNLAQVKAGESYRKAVTEAALGQNIVATSAVTFIWTAVVYRMYWRYGERGYRYLHLDAGHVCQNLYLASEAVNCGTCAIGAFRDEDINELLGLEGEDQFVVYMASCGKKYS
jgi:SagB-type dehydrogenase family enzyme